MLFFFRVLILLKQVIVAFTYKLIGLV